MGGQEKAYAKQNAGGHRDALHAETLLQFAGNGGGDCQTKAQQAKGKSDLAYRFVKFFRKRAIEQAPGVDGTEGELGNDGADEGKPADSIFI
ncbi:hypothetical protein HMPREF0880_01195 [Yokenella regensburgei ATCC 43003]|nr:hypothetical protein HMPREF0880_01195 [Yokenella regensburgei ATCC 43003]